MTVVNCISIVAGLAVAWLLGYWCGHRQTMKHLDAALRQFFYLPSQGDKR